MDLETASKLLFDHLGKGWVEAEGSFYKVRYYRYLTMDKAVISRLTDLGLVFSSITYISGALTLRFYDRTRTSKKVDYGKDIT